jgi:redox-sensitive bicupin YhaK (pirin superfamily)
MSELTTKQNTPLVHLTKDHYAVLDEDDFGVPGLVAHEIIGPFVNIHASGPLIMVHDGVFEPRHGIGHHPHRYNERLFYILEGAVDHDDAQNGITGHMATGDMGRLTEGITGMLHKEWNNTDGQARAFILVYETDPTPETASFLPLRDADTPRFEESQGVTTKELVGPNVNFPVNGDIRLFTDSTMLSGSILTTEIAPGEGALVFPIDGEIEVGGGPLLSADDTLLVPPTPHEHTLVLGAATDARVLRAVHGPGRGFIQRH